MCGGAVPAHHPGMSIERTTADLESPTPLPNGQATRALIAHANGDHLPDELGRQGDCPACQAAAAA